MKKAKLFLQIVFLLCSTFVFADVINVPDQQPTIQAGINASVNGDTVLVQPGTYVENINYSGKNITIASLFYTTQDTDYISQTIIDGNQTDRVVTFENGEDTTAIFCGFTIKNGSGTEHGGGIFCNNSGATINNCIIANNNSYGFFCYGGGISCINTSTMNIISCEISNNATIEDDHGYGGGLYCVSSDVTVIDCKFSGNHGGWGQGGGIRIDAGCNANIESCEFINNFSEWGGGGVGISGETTVIISECTLINNNAVYYGGGIYDDGNNTTIKNCLILDNGQSHYGGGITTGAAAVINCTIINNNAVYFGGGLQCNNIPITNCIIRDNSPDQIQNDHSPVVSYSNVQGDWPGTGNIDADPFFDENYHLTWANYPNPDVTKSLCIDSGDPIPQYNDPDGTRNDMGAFYFPQVIADFSANQTTIVAGTEIQFTDLSTGNPTSWEWDFQNDGTINSEEQNPEWTYSEIGTYSVSLTVSDGTRTTSTETKTDYITVTSLSNWEQKFPIENPSIRSDHEMVFIEEHKVLLFGGHIPTGSGFDNETWLYDLDLNTWTNMNPSQSPSPRQVHGLAHIGDDKVIFFGGYDGSGPPYENDTWIYDLSENSWTQKYPPTSPSGRDMHEITYIGDDKVLLYGGNTGWGGYQQDTWAYDLSENTWTNKNPDPHPPDLVRHDMAYLGDDKVLLFGGSIYTQGTNSDETWVYDLSENTWTQKFTISHPSKRHETDMACFGENRILLFGGDATEGLDNETWIYDLNTNTWFEDINFFKPSARKRHALTATSLDGSSDIVLFGGEDALGFNNETWAYNVTDTLLVASFTADITSGEAPLTVQFTDLSIGNPTSWQWDFQNDGMIDSYEQNPEWTFMVGEYTVCLTVSDGIHTDSVCKVDLIIVSYDEAPVITSIYDIPNDQGGWVYIEFLKSIHDTDTLRGTESYTVQRFDNQVWISLSSMLAYGQDQYTVEARTLKDSSNTSSGITSFRILAGMDEGNWASEPDSGNSVDNIAPFAPENLEGYATDNTIHLNWTEPVDEDFQYFAVYKTDETGQFVEDPYATTIESQIDDMVELKDHWYKITAFDFNGNESNTSSTLTSQVIQLPSGWSGLSGYVLPDFPDIETVLETVINELIILQNNEGMYWPGQNVNTLGSWDVNSGYCLKVLDEGILPIVGKETNQNTLVLSDGWSIIPVLSECEVDVASLFDGYNVEIVKEVAGWNVYWPEFGINTLEIIEPGKAYFVMMGSDGEIMFPECTTIPAFPLKGEGAHDPSIQLNVKERKFITNDLRSNDAALWAGTPLLLQEKGSGDEVFVVLPGAEVMGTPSTHTIAIPAHITSVFPAGTILTAKDGAGNCFGVVALQGGTTALTIFGDDQLTSEKDGFFEGEPIYLRLFNPQTKTEEMIDVVFDPSMPDREGTFGINGLSAIQSLATGVALVSNNNQKGVDIYPNPANRLLHIHLGSTKSADLEILNIHGQVMVSEHLEYKQSTLNISHLPRGLYIMQLDVEDKHLCRKLVKD